MDAEKARGFVRENHRAVLITRRRDGSLQSSPVAAGVDDEGRILVSTPSATAKARNLDRDPRATLCCVTDAWYGPWLSVDGDAEVVHQPESMELLVDYYRRTGGEHPDWEEYRAAMRDEDRVMIRISITRVAGELLSA